MKRLIALLVLLFLPVAARAAFLDYDTFTRADSASMGSTEGQSAAWSSYTASAEISNNTMRIAGTANEDARFYLSSPTSTTWAVNVTAKSEDAGGGAEGFMIASGDKDVMATACAIQFDDGDLKIVSDGGTFYMKVGETEVDKYYVLSVLGDAATDKCYYKVVNPNGTIVYYNNSGAGYAMQVNLVDMDVVRLHYDTSLGAAANNYIEDGYVCAGLNYSCYPVAAAPSAPVVSWEGYTPYNNSNLISVPVIFFFNHTSGDNLNCSLWKNDSVTVYYSGVPSNVSAWYPFESGSGLVAFDNSSFVNNGLLSSGISWVNSKGSNGTGNKALNFSGSLSFVNVSNGKGNNFTNDFTIMLWVMPYVQTSNRGLVVKGQNSTVSQTPYRIDFQNTNQNIYAYIGNGITFNQVGTTSGIPYSKYSHITLRLNATKLSLFVNGKLNNSVARTINPLISNRQLLVGSILKNSFNFKGVIDEVVLLPVALSSSEIINVYNNGVIRSYANTTSGFISIENKTDVSGDVKQNFTLPILANGNYEFFVSCDSANSSVKFINMNGSLPVIDFLNITNQVAGYALISDGVYEYVSGPWNLSVSVSQDDYFGLRLYNSSALLGTQENLDVMEVADGTFAGFVTGNPYNLSVFANNTFGGSFDSLLFSISDTVLPLCLGNHNDTYNITNNTYFTWNVSCVDELVFSFNVSCVGSDNFSFYQEDINNVSYNFYNSTLLLEDTICYFEYCDGHTSEKISPFSLAKNVSSGEFVVEGISLKSNRDIDDITWNKRRDRYEFCYDLARKEPFIDFIIPDGCHHISSGYSGHLVCPGERIWIDFESDEGYPVSVYGDTVYVDISKAKDSRVCFSSVGKFNCVSITQVLSVHIPFGYEFGRLEACPTDTTPRSIVFIGLLFIITAVWMFAIFIKVPAFNFVMGFVLLYSITWQAVRCVEFLHVMFIGMGLLSVLYGGILLLAKQYQ